MIHTHKHRKIIYLNSIESFLLNSYEFVKGIFIYYKYEKKIIFPLSKSGWKLLISLWKHFGCPYNRYERMIFGDYILVTDSMKDEVIKKEVKKVLLEQMNRTLEELHSFGIYETELDKSGKKFDIIENQELKTIGWKIKATHRELLFLRVVRYRI